MTSFLAVCTSWIVCSQAIASTHHANHGSKSNSTTLFSINPDDNAQFSSLFSNARVQHHVESDDQVNDIGGSNYAVNDLLFMPCLSLSSEEHIEKWVETRIDETIDTRTTNNDLNTLSVIPNYAFDCLVTCRPLCGNGLGSSVSRPNYFDSSTPIVFSTVRSHYIAIVLCRTYTNVYKTQELRVRHTINTFNTTSLSPIFGETYFDPSIIQFSSLFPSTTITFTEVRSHINIYKTQKCTEKGDDSERNVSKRTQITSEGGERKPTQCEECDVHDMLNLSVLILLLTAASLAVQCESEIKMLILSSIVMTCSAVPFIPTQISTGNTFTCALSTSNTVKCWGNNANGNLGRGDLNDTVYAPPSSETIDLGTNFVPIQITAGGGHACALSTSNTVKCFGRNDRGQLGLGDVYDRGDEPGEMGDSLNTIDLGTNFIPAQIWAISAFTCALSQQNTIKCWGHNFAGQLGVGDVSNRGDEPNEMGDFLNTVDLGTNFVPLQIAVGGSYVCVLSQNNSVKCFGSNEFGQLGRGDTISIGDNPGEMGDNLTTIDLGSNFIPVQISAGEFHNCALSENSEIKCWGSGEKGALGSGQTGHRGDDPGEMGDSLNTTDLGTSFIPTQILASSYYTCALSQNHTVKCFGTNNFGQLGRGDTIRIGDHTGEMGDDLTTIDLGTNFIPTQLSTGSPGGTSGAHNCALSQNNAAKCWGLNSKGQLGVADVNNRGDGADQMGDFLNTIDFGMTILITGYPTATPTFITVDPTATPTSVTVDPTATPSGNPSIPPSDNPSSSPTKVPSSHPTTHPSLSPSYNPSSSPSANPSISPSEYPSLSPTTHPSLSPTSIHPTESPTNTPTTSYPTLPTPVTHQFLLTLIGNYDELQQYINATNSNMVMWAKGIIETMINIVIYPQLTNVIITIHNVRRGSVIIDYSLQVDVISLLDLAEENINSTAEINAHANLTMHIASNTRYTLNPTTHPSQSPTMKPTKPPLKPAETHNPTTAPTKQPTGSPTMVPTHAPTTSSPSTDPTVSPTFDPTKAPTPQDIQCNDAGISSETDGDYEYYLHIDEQSIVRFDTCRTLSLFDIFIVDTNDTNKNYSCIECGSICYEPSQYQVALSVGKYRMDIHGPHAFKMICTPKPDNDAPTSSPTTNEPTKTPTGYPSINPTTSRPTEPVYPVFNVSFTGDGVPISGYTFLGDPYGRFEAYIQIVVYDAESVLGVTALCAECFIWQYRLRNGVWTDIEHANDNDISVYNQQVTSINAITTYQSRLTIQSIRRLNAGRCVDENDNSRLFKPDNMYELRLQFVVDREYFVSSISNALSIETNTLPSGGFCAIQDFENLKALKQYNLFCDGWNNEDNLEYNALLKDVLMSTHMFVDDARKLQSVAPVGNISITVMIKERNVDAITCYPIQAAFKRIANTINDRLNQNRSQNINASSIVDDILDDVSRIANMTSFADNPDVAVSIVTVIEDIYAENYTTQNEAARIVDDIVSNILEGSGSGSGVLDGEDIITELTTISTITSNKDIVDAETTTTLLVDSYLPQIFEAIDVFVDANGSAIQDQLYTIAGQSQQLIENLESTLQVAEEAVDNLNNLAQSLVDYATLAASKALSKSDVGETFNYETTEYNEDGTIKNTKTIVATKFDANIIDFNDSNIANEEIILPKCGNEEQNIELPLSFMREQDGVFDCAFMASSRNNFVSKQNINRTQQSDTVSINIYNIGSIPNEYESNSCFPYLITMQISDFNYDDDMSLGDEHVFPSCDFWNVTDSSWDTHGCVLYDISDTSTTVTCACTHLTTFSVSKDNLVPEANFFTQIDWRQFTLYNLYHYPTVWLTCLLVFVVFIFICGVSPLICDKIKTKSIMAFEDIIYKSVKEDKLYKDIAGKEVKYLTDYMPNQHLLGRGLQTVAPTKEAKRSICRLQWKLYGTYLRNDHTLLSVVQRTAGTNISLKQRLGCFFMYLCTIMVVTGTFYGLEQSTPSQDVVASFIISLCSTMPVKLVRYFFRKSKPIQVKSTKHILLDDDIDAEVAALGDNVTTMITVRAPKEQWDMKAWMKETNGVTISILNEQIETLYDQENQQHKIHVINKIRSVLFDKMFPLSHGFKRVGWIVLIIWSLAACITAIVYGFKFDLEATAIALYQNDDCWNNTLALQVESRLSKKAFQLDYIEQETKNASSYAGGDAESWLVSIFQSLLTSLLLWQPLRIYVFTWIKIWMFSYHLKMQIGPGGLLNLCKRCCCGYDVAMDHPLDEEKHPDPIANNKVVTHKNRPVDIISFLGSEEWIIDDTNYVNDDAIELHANGNCKQTAHQALDSTSLSNRNVDSNALVSVQEGEGVELQAITQIKHVSGSGSAQLAKEDAKMQGVALPHTAGGTSSNDEVKEDDTLDEKERDMDTME